MNINSRNKAKQSLGDKIVLYTNKKNIYTEGELTKNSTCSKMEQVQIEGGRPIKRIIDFYNLDAIINSSEKLEGLREVVALLESPTHAGRLKGRVTLKVTKELVNE